jgi:hypothetical protein
MDTDIYAIYKERVREEMSVGEYDDAIIEYYLHGNAIVERYLNDVAVQSATKELLAVR